MPLDRRTFLSTFAAATAMLPHASRGAAFDAAPARFAATRKDDRGTFAAAMFDLEQGDICVVELPARGHDIALRPGGREWVALARRPGRFGVAVRGDGQAPIWFSAKPDRHFFGHGVFAADGRLLYTTENDFARGQGVIGVRDVEAGYRQIGELPSYGIGPHDLALLSDGRTLVIANGGIRTHPNQRRAELNLAAMQPSLVYVDVETGERLEEQRLVPALHQLSIRHLAVARNDMVVFGCQFRGTGKGFPPLVGFHRRGEAPALVPAPDGTQAALRNYIGSVAADASGTIVAASAPRGGLITYWDVRSKRFLGTCELRDGCGLAPTHHGARFLLTSGEGWLATGEAAGIVSQQLSRYHWDNHVILVR